MTFLAALALLYYIYSAYQLMVVCKYSLFNSSIGRKLAHSAIQWSRSLTLAFHTFSGIIFTSIVFFFFTWSQSLPDVCRCEAFGWKLWAGGLSSRSRELQPSEHYRQWDCCKETQSKRAQEGLPLLPLQQGLPEQQQPQPAHSVTRYAEINEMRS